MRDDLFSKRTATGGIAQLVERQLCKLDVRGSIPGGTTKKPLKSSGFFVFLFQNYTKLDFC